jgi:hypothetical protein
VSYQPTFVKFPGSAPAGIAQVLGSIVSVPTPMAYGLMSVWLEPDTPTLYQYEMRLSGHGGDPAHGAGDPTDVILLASSNTPTLQIIYAQIFTRVLLVTFEDPVPAALVHWITSFDPLTATVQLYCNGAALGVVSVQWFNPGPTPTPEPEPLEMIQVSDSAGTLFQYNAISTANEGCVADVYAASLSSFYDLSNPINLAKFISGGNAVDLGAHGTNPTGSAPQYWFTARGGAAGYLTNSGSGGGAWTATSPIALCGLFMRVTQSVIEVLIWNQEPIVPPIYPTLAGLTFSVIKRPIFFGGIAASVSGREVRVGYASTPLWEWDLTYTYLADEQTASSTTPSDLKQLVGFFLAMSGALSGFLFKDPDDNTISDQVMVIGDGVTRSFLLTRSYGGSDGVGVEAVGYVELDQPFAVYLDGVLLDPSGYSVITTTPVNQRLNLTTAPGSGVTLAVTMTYYYYCRFREQTYDFEKFMDKLWSQHLISLHSLRG